MKNTTTTIVKIFDLKSTHIKLLTTALLLLVTALAPMAINQQLVLGTIINASLVLATMMVSPVLAMLLAVIPSSIALMSGSVPSAMQIMIPFIISSNMIYALSFKSLSEKSANLAIILSSLLKFAFLAISVRLVFHLVDQSLLNSTIVAMLTWPQLYTATAGAILATTITKISNFKK